MKKFLTWPIVLLFLMTVTFFKSFTFSGKMPIPADTIVGMYYPWKDHIWNNFTNGVPFRNFLITDPVRQQYPWRNLVGEQLKKGDLPRWNPYSLTGTPLLANFQAAVFYPFNLLFLVLPFSVAWSILIIFQPLLAGFFMHLFLREQKLPKMASWLGAIVFAFSGWAMVWLEWGTVVHTGLWLPLILLAIGRISQLRITSYELQKKRFLWSFIFVFSLTCSFFAGHLQTFFYVFVFSCVYLVWRLFRLKNGRFKLILLFAICYLLFAAVTVVQWRPTLALINQSGREIDQADWQTPGWFLPWQNLVQFLAPDFFGNPATLNYFGVWNYVEFSAYLGVVPLFLVLTVVFSRKGKKEWFYLLSLLVCLSLVLPTPWAKLPFVWKLPLVSTSQPTRLLFLVGFCGAVLAAFGFEQWRVKKITKIPLLLLAILYFSLWAITRLLNLGISQRNLILPTGLLTIVVFLTALSRRWWSVLLVLGLVVFDLFRFGWKFNAFSSPEWLFPSTRVIDFLKQDEDVFRIMTTDRRLLPPNFEIVYRLQSIAGYDPLYLRRYGELIAAMERGEPNIAPPFGFQRIITPHNYASRLADLLNVKYVLSLTDLASPKLELVFRERETRVYRNRLVLPRAFLVGDYRLAKTKQEAINFLFDQGLRLDQTAVLEMVVQLELPVKGENFTGKAEIKRYEANQVELEYEAGQPAILVLTDAYYPDWRARLDGELVSIYRADFNFRAIIVPEGRHQVVFSYGD